MEEIIAKVQKLLNKAEHEATTETERFALTEKAAELMAKYGIDQALIEAKAEVKTSPVNYYRDIPNPFSSAKASLLSVVARAFNCQAILVNKSKHGGSFTRVHLFGYQSDLDAVEIIFTSLLLQGTQATIRVPRGENARSYRTSAWYGFSRKVSERLQEANRTVQAASEPGTALVLRDRSLDVQAALRDTYPRTVQLTRHLGSSRGYEDGKAAGERANLHNRPSAYSSSRPALDR